MKANEFIKKYGLDEAKVFVNNVIDHLSMGADFDVEELKRLIESHELVENLGGLNEAKGEFFEIVHSGYYVEVSPSALRKAIADVESCQ